MEPLAPSDGAVGLSITFTVRDVKCHEPALGNPYLLENHLQKLIRECCKQFPAAWPVLFHTDPADSPTKAGRLPGDP